MYSSESEPLDKVAAVGYGKAINAAYDMYRLGGPDSLHPRPLASFPSDYEMTAWIHMSDFAVFGEKVVRFYGYVARRITDSFQHIIVVRGTEDPIEWWDDANFWPIRFRPEPSAGFVHGGFDRIYSTMRVIRCPRPAVPDSGEPDNEAKPIEMSGTFADQIENLLTTLTPQTGPEGSGRKHQFTVAAHSLGGALCTLYVMEHAIKKRADPHRQVVINRICTFASPRVGMHTFVSQFKKLPIDSWRIVNTQDIVPMVPIPIPFVLPYEHVPNAYPFSSAGIVKFSPACWHSMSTYLHWLDESQPLAPGCARGK